MEKFALVLLASLSLAGSSSGESTYHIGNSLTNDSIGGSSAQIAEIAALSNSSLNVGMHIDSSQPLEVIWNDPAGADLYTPSTWPDALDQNVYDYVTFQPHDSQGSTLGQDRQRISDFIGATSSSPVFYILQTWPNQNKWPYTDYWDNAVDDSPTTLTTKKRAYFDTLLAQARADNPSPPIWMVPTGEVLYELEQQVIAGTLPGVTSLDFFFRDFIHMDYGVGRWLAGKTMYATMFQENPIGTGIPPGAYTAGNQPSAALIDAINDTIWSVISSSPWSGYSDFNRDGSIDGEDLLVWKSNYGSGRDGLDFLAWQLQYQGPTASNSIIVPEPDTLVLALILLVLRFFLPHACMQALVVFVF